jgi:signal peptidase II
MNKRKIFYSLIAILFLAGIDQVSKRFFIAYLIENDQVSNLRLLPILDFVYAWNYGISFGLFSKYSDYSNIIFLALNSIIVVYLYLLMLKTKTNLSHAGFALVIAGALGNIIDRILYGAVFDFIYFHYDSLAFPAFNVADSFITIGAGLLIYDYMFCRKK